MHNRFTNKGGCTFLYSAHFLFPSTFSNIYSTCFSRFKYGWRIGNHNLKNSPRKFVELTPVRIYCAFLVVYFHNSLLSFFLLLLYSRRVIPSKFSTNIGFSSSFILFLSRGRCEQFNTNFLGQFSASFFFVYFYLFLLIFFFVCVVLYHRYK